MGRQDKATAHSRRRHPPSATAQSAPALKDGRPMSPAPQRSKGCDAIRDAVTSPRMYEEEFAAVFASTTVGVTVLSPAADFLQVNDAFCQIVGYSPEELAQLNCLALTHPDDRPEMDAKIAALVAGEIPTFDILKR